MSEHPSVTAADLAAGYATNALSIRLAAGRYLIEPVAASGGRADDIPIEVRHRIPLYLVSAWNPAGAPTTFEGNALHAARLEASVARRTHNWRRGVLIGAGGGWFEQVVALSGRDERHARSLARRCKQPAFIRIDADGWHVLPTGLVEGLEPITVGWRLRERTQRTCAMRALDPAAEPCTMHGGPFGSLAISAAAKWAHARFVAVSLLGCDPCEHRAVEVPDVGLVFNPNLEWCVGSRYGASVVRDKRRPRPQIQVAVIGDDYPGLEAGH